MPHIDITMYPGRSSEIKSALALKVQQAVCDELKMDSKYISVSIEDVPKDEWEQHMASFSEEDMFIKPNF